MTTRRDATRAGVCARDALFVVFYPLDGSSLNDATNDGADADARSLARRR
jgi:hypothetical protein